MGNILTCLEDKKKKHSEPDLKIWSEKLEKLQVKSSFGNLMYVAISFASWT